MKPFLSVNRYIAALPMRIAMFSSFHSPVSPIFREMLASRDLRARYQDHGPQKQAPPSPQAPEIGEEFLPAEGASEADVVAQRDNITLNSGAAYADFHFAARNACSQEFISQTGLGSVDIMGASAADVIAEPSGNFYTDVTASTEAEWIAGDYYVACSLGWEDFDKSPMTAVLGSGVTIADFFTPKWPMELRRCTQWVGTDGTENVIASCDEAHWMEDSVLIDPWAVLGEDARQAVDPTTIDEEKLMELDAYCSAFTDSFIGDGAPPDAYKSTSVWFNWGEDQLPTNMVCGVSVIDSETLDVVGSLAGIGAGSPQTVEVPAA